MMHPLAELRLQRRLAEIEHNAQSAQKALKKGDTHDLIPRLLRSIASTAVATLLEVKSYYDEAEGANGAGAGAPDGGPADADRRAAGDAARGADGVQSTGVEDAGRA